MRRSTGIQALECHVLVTRSSLDATKIVNEIKNVSNRYKNELNQKTKVFQYQPFSENTNIGNKERNINHFTSNNEFERNLNQHQSSKKISLLPPKSPYSKSQKKTSSSSKQVEKSENKSNRSVIYDAYESNPKNHEPIQSNIGSKSAVNISSKSNSSIFSKIKNNLVDKSSHSKSTNQQNRANRPLGSSSEILFTSKDIHNVETGSTQNRQSSAQPTIGQNNQKSLEQSSSTSIAYSDVLKKEKNSALANA